MDLMNIIETTIGVMIAFALLMAIEYARDIYRNIQRRGKW